MRYQQKEIKQYVLLSYSGCILDENMSGKTMVNIIKKPCTKIKYIKTKKSLKFFYRKNLHFTSILQSLLCNGLMQPHFDYAASGQYLNLHNKFQK